MRPHQRRLTRLAAPRVDGVIAVARRQVEPLARLGYRRERIEVIANGVAPAPEGPPGRRLAGADEFGVLCAARMQPEKRVDLFVRAIAAARRSQPAIRGFVAGDGSERARIEALAEGSGVALLGARGDIPALLAGADAFALTSEAEALPMSILEAMALGVPVIAPDLGGTSDAVVHGETGLLVAPGDPVRSSGRCSSWRAIRSGRGGWARPGGRASASSPPRRRWRTPISARWRGWRPVAASARRPPGDPAALARHHARLARGRLDLPRAARASGREHGGCVGAHGRERPAAPRLPGHDVVEASRRALCGAVRRHRPRAVVISTTTRRCWPTRTACLRCAPRRPRRPQPPGPPERGLHALERRRSDMPARSAVERPRAWPCLPARRVEATDRAEEPHVVQVQRHPRSAAERRQAARSTSGRYCARGRRRREAVDGGGDIGLVRPRAAAPARRRRGWPGWKGARAGSARHPRRRARSCN